MKLRAKIAIIMIAVMITFAGFNLMVSSSTVDLMKIAKKAGYDRISNIMELEANTAVEYKPKI